MKGRLRFERYVTDERIGHLVLSYPGRMNAIGMAPWRALRVWARGVDALLPHLHAVIVRGDEGCSSAGAGVTEFPQWRFDPATLREYLEGIVASALQASRAVEVPLIAQIEGDCIGGGLEVALCCDLRVGDHEACFGVPAARLGFPMAPDECALLLDVLGREAVAEPPFEARLHGSDWPCSVEWCSASWTTRPLRRTRPRGVWQHG